MIMKKDLNIKKKNYGIHVEEENKNNKRTQFHHTHSTGRFGIQNFFLPMRLNERKQCYAITDHTKHSSNHGMGERFKRERNVRKITGKRIFVCTSIKYFVVNCLNVNTCS